MTLNSEHFMYYNVAIIVVTLLMIILAYRRGFVRQFLNLAALVGSIYLSAISCSQVAEQFPIYKALTQIQLGINKALWFLILLIVLRIFFWVVILLIPKYRKHNALAFINHFLGMILGIVKAFLILLLVTFTLRLSVINNGKEFISSGVLMPFNQIIEGVIESGSSTIESIN